MAIGLKGRESIRIEEGKHTGKVVKVEQRTNKDFEYIDVHIELSQKTMEGKPIIIRWGAPADLTVNTRLGKTLMQFGISEKAINSGQVIDVEEVLVGQKVSFLTKDETTDKGTFARVLANFANLNVDGSLKPA